MFRGKQKAWVAAAYAAVVALLQVLAQDASYTPWVTVVLVVLTPLSVYLVPNKPYVNP